MPTGIYLHKTGRFVSQITRKKMSKIHKGKIISVETRKKISDAQKKIGNRPPSWLGKKHSLKTRIKMSKRFSGKNSHFWKGGVSKENKRIRESLKYSLWREKVFKRDKYICQECGRRGGTLNADHIKQFAYHKKLRFKVSNGRTLCVPCHEKTDTFKRKYE